MPMTDDLRQHRPVVVVLRDPGRPDRVLSLTRAPARLVYRRGAVDILYEAHGIDAHNRLVYVPLRAATP
jgi:hypothetical protein